MEPGVFYYMKIEFILELFFMEFLEKYPQLFSGKNLEEKFGELFEKKEVHQEFTSFCIQKVYLLVFSPTEAKKMKELFLSRAN